MPSLKISPAARDAITMHIIEDAIDPIPFTVVGRMLTYTDRDAVFDELMMTANHLDECNDHTWRDVLARLASRVLREPG